MNNVAHEQDQLHRPTCPINAQVIEYRVGALEEAIRQISLAVKTIAENTSQIASLELLHAETQNALKRAFDEMKLIEGRREKVDERVQAIERDLPSLKESSRWIKSGVVVIAGAVIIAAIKISLHF